MRTKLQCIDPEKLSKEKSTGRETDGSPLGEGNKINFMGGLKLEREMKMVESSGKWDRVELRERRKGETVIIEGI